jgi:DNA-directed RNA polymerase omega subunit
MIKNREVSRGPRLDMDKCSEIAGGRFQLVIAAAQRAREISRNADPMDPYKGSIVTSLLEVQEGELNIPEYLSKAGKR